MISDRRFSNCKKWPALGTMTNWLWLIFSAPALATSGFSLPVFLNFTI